MRNYIKKVIPDVYNFYKDYIDKNNYCPSYRKIKQETNIHLDYISKAVQWLVENNYLIQLKKGIYIVNQEKDFKGFE